MEHTIRGALCVSLLIAASGAAHAASISGQGTWESTLQGRDLDGNLSTFEAYYDTTLDITWLADANYAMTSGYDADGHMTWADANAWAANLDPYGSGITGWRLPDTNPVNGVSYDYSYTYNGSTDSGSNISAPGTAYVGSTGSEMAYMFYNTLGNLAFYDTSGDFQPGFGLTNTGPFSNVQSYNYWSATEEYAPDYAWTFTMFDGSQELREKPTSFYAWAVHSGDVGASVVPVPAAVWLFVSGLLGLIGVGRKRRR